MEINHLAVMIPDTQEFSGLRRVLVQLDREGSRKKSLRGLQRMLEKSTSEMKPYIGLGLGIGFYLDQDYSRSLSHLKDITVQFSLSPLSIFAATLIVSIYRSLGMKRERFDAEGSRLQIMKRIAMQSQDPSHRILALNELKKELEARELHEEAHQCDLELNYWQSIAKKKKQNVQKNQILS